MTDQERARACSDRWGGPDGPLLDTHEERDLMREFAAVRIDERAQIAAWLRSVMAEHSMPARVALLNRAGLIERGEHAGGGS